MEIVVKLSHLLKIDFCSFFWMQYFYSYLEYDEQKNMMKPTQLFALANSAAAKKILTDTLSSTGLKYRSLIASALQSDHTTEARTTAQTQETRSPRRYLLLWAMIIAAVAVVTGTVVYFLRSKRKSP